MVTLPLITIFLLFSPLPNNLHLLRHLSFFSPLPLFFPLGCATLYCLPSNGNRWSQKRPSIAGMPMFRLTSDSSPPPSTPHLTSEWSHRRPKLEHQQRRMEVWRSQIDVQWGLIEVRGVRIEVMWSWIEDSAMCASVSRAPHLGMAHRRPPPWEMHSSSFDLTSTPLRAQV
jgi:hypothetical protein